MASRCQCQVPAPAAVRERLSRLALGSGLALRAAASASRLPGAEPSLRTFLRFTDLFSVSVCGSLEFSLSINTVTLFSFTARASWLCSYQGPGVLVQPRPLRETGLLNLKTRTAGASNAARLTVP